MEHLNSAMMYISCGLILSMPRGAPAGTGNIRCAEVYRQPVSARQCCLQAMDVCTAGGMRSVGQRRRSTANYLIARGASLSQMMKVNTGSASLMAAL